MSGRAGSGLRALLLCAALLASGCATVDPFALPPIAQHLERNDAVGECARLLREYDRRVVEAGVRDAQDTLVPGFPYLRVDRLAERLGERLDPMTEAATDRLAPPAPRPAPSGFGAPWAAWLQRLAVLDRGARAHELRNAADRLPLAPSIAALGLDGCRGVLLDADSDAPQALRALRQAARVPDDYVTALRVLGVYWLTRIPFAAGVRRWQAQTRAVFALPLEALPVTGALRRLAPDGAEAPATPARLARDVLGVPRIGDATLRALLRRHAPVVEIDTTGEFDRPGALAIEDGGVLVRSEARVPVYTRLAFAELGGALRPQLVYTLWFPQRPKDGTFDLLGGHLDALVWRVTLDDDGAALLYDSIHACGCYHQFFPTRRLRARAQPPPDQGVFDEGLFAPQDPLPVARADEGIVLRVASRTHYLQRVRPGAGPGDADGVEVYRLEDEDALRSLPVAAGLDRRSVYDASGFIPGSERLERVFFWPMGIASAGQMRQWGRHATAFVGRRHFDDPRLPDRYFELLPAAGQ